MIICYTYSVVRVSSGVTGVVKDIAFQTKIVDLSVENAVMDTSYQTHKKIAVMGDFGARNGMVAIHETPSDSRQEKTRLLAGFLILRFSDRC